MWTSAALSKGLRKKQTPMESLGTHKNIQSANNEALNRKMKGDLGEWRNEERSGGKAVSRRRARRTCEGCVRHNRVWLPKGMKESKWKCNGCTRSAESIRVAGTKKGTRGWTYRRMASQTSPNIDEIM